jgi:hypothetical protein
MERRPVDVAALAVKHGFAEEAEAFAALARPAIELVPAADLAEGPIVGRLGGVPALPADVEWPRSTRDFDRGAPLTFFGSFDLSMLPADVWPGPTSGTLNVFVLLVVNGMYVDGGAVALHHPAGSVLEPREFPAEFEPEQRSEEVPVRGRVITTLPWAGVGPARELIPFNIDISNEEAYKRLERYSELAAEVSGRSAWSTPNQLVGWPKFVQDDIHYTWESQATDAAVEPWQLLLQVGDGAHHMRPELGDSGVFMVGIPQRALSAGNFERVDAYNDRD